MRPDSAQHHTGHEKSLGFIFRRLFQQECGKEVGRGADQSQHLGAVTTAVSSGSPGRWDGGGPLVRGRQQGEEGRRWCEPALSLQAH